MAVSKSVTRRYEVYEEDRRLWEPGAGDLTRLRTWDIFDRYLPRSGRVLDVGGGPGTHAEYLSGQGFEVTLIDPVDRHVERARQRSGGRFKAQLGDAHDLAAADQSVDIVLLMGPLYHLFTIEDRGKALRETRRVLRPGGILVAEVITRHAWILDATVKGLLGTPGIWGQFDENLRTGLSQEPAQTVDGAFWAYFHRPDELVGELLEAGFIPKATIAVEGFAWLLGDLEGRMRQPEALLRAITLTETEASMLGCSGHVIGIATVE